MNMLMVEIMADDDIEAGGFIWIMQSVLALKIGI